MALSISLWVRDTALRLRQEGIDLTKNALSNISSFSYGGMYSSNDFDKNPWEMEAGNEVINLKEWL